MALVSIGLETLVFEPDAQTTRPPPCEPWHLWKVFCLVVKSSQVYFTIRTFQEYASRKQRKDHAVIKADCTL